MSYCVNMFVDMCLKVKTEVISNLKKKKLNVSVDVIL
jgi:hypothetical protein